ncbi:hypothetical protein OF83DRAFT_1170540 [Amylostereum chailletii]|nr:hypothetical protein OF83DRAFT_1170540 [Amylostereum chailletii]
MHKPQSLPSSSFLFSYPLVPFSHFLPDFTSVSLEVDERLSVLIEFSATAPPSDVNANVPTAFTGTDPPAPLMPLSFSLLLSLGDGTILAYHPQNIRFTMLTAFRTPRVVHESARKNQSQPNQLVAKNDIPRQETQDMFYRKVHRLTARNPAKAYCRTYPRHASVILTETTFMPTATNQCDAADDV